MCAAYCRIFRRMGLSFGAVEADTGAIGGRSSHEFMVIADSGEDAIVSCGDCEYSANVEKAECGPDGSVPAATPAPGPPRQVPTPGKRTIGEGSAFLGIPPGPFFQTLLSHT